MRCSHAVEEKRVLRARLRAARAARPAPERELAGRAIAGHGTRAWAGADVVASYAGTADEPPTRALLDGLLAAGVRVVLPIVAGPQRLAWGGYAGWERLVPGPHGVPQPAEPDPTFELERAVVVIVPALAVDGRGNRLGRGAGYYDRALAGLDVPTVAVVFDDEVLPEVPTQEHDVAVGAALTPSGLRPLLR